MSIHRTASHSSPPPASLTLRSSRLFLSLPPSSTSRGNLPRVLAYRQPPDRCSLNLSHLDLGLEPLSFSREKSRAYIFTHCDDHSCVGESKRACEPERERDRCWAGGKHLNGRYAAATAAKERERERGTEMRQCQGRHARAHSSSSPLPPLMPFIEFRLVLVPSLSLSRTERKVEVSSIRYICVCACSGEARLRCIGDDFFLLRM